MKYERKYQIVSGKKDYRLGIWVEIHARTAKG
jgi:hypothetical protein